MPPRSRRLRATLHLLVLSMVCSTAGLSLAKPAKDELRAAKREASADEPGAKPKRRDDSADPRDGKPSAGDAQARTLARLRDHLEITDDSEWALVADRISKVEECRRNLWGSSAGARGFMPAGEKARRSTAGGRSANPERDALRSAVGEKLPDAEIKSRLDRAHEVYRQNEARLVQAQANLRAVLTIRQEAVIVMAGLLPP